jgi:hypothetical protein
MYETPILWLLLLTVGVACLGAAMVYGTMRNRKRTRSSAISPRLQRGPNIAPRIATSANFPPTRQSPGH